MSDPNNPGDPVEEPTSVDDVVGRANEGLAEAEAARRDAAGDAEEARAAESGDAEPADLAPAAATADDAHADAAPAATDSTADIPWYERDDVPLDDEPAASTDVAAAPVDASADTTIVAEDSATTVLPREPEPREAEVVAVAPAVQQPIFVQAPEPPRPRGNRGAAGGIGLLAAIVFGILYLAVALGLGFASGDVTGENIGESLTTTVTSFALWVPVVVFFIAFWLLGAIINRGRWGHWVVFGLLVGVAAYGGHILGQLFQAPFWELTASQGQELVQNQLLTPLAIAAFVIGRELTIWFGAWVAARGKRVTELNYEAQREYERTLEAGPSIVPTAQG